MLLVLELTEADDDGLGPENHQLVARPVGSNKRSLPDIFPSRTYNKLGCGILVYFSSIPLNLIRLGLSVRHPVLTRSQQLLGGVTKWKI